MEWNKLIIYISHLHGRFQFCSVGGGAVGSCTQELKKKLQLLKLVLVTNIENGYGNNCSC